MASRIVASGPAGTISGEIVDARTGERVEEARVMLLDAQRSPVSVDSAVVGRPFALAAALPGSYALVVQRVEYRRRELSVVVPDSKGLSIAVALDVLTTDECPGFAKFMVPRPWWKWWYPPKAPPNGSFNLAGE